VCVSPDPANNLNEFHTMNKTMEYMAMGKPAVAFDLKETRVSAQGAAVYARPNDVSDLGTKLLELLDDPEQRAEMGRIGLERVKGELCWEHSQPALLAAYAHAFEGL
jgi:glycosyltransferase involved in cell wall biosynthesis